MLSDCRVILQISDGESFTYIQVSWKRRSTSPRIRVGRRSGPSFTSRQGTLLLISSSVSSFIVSLRSFTAVPFKICASATTTTLSMSTATDEKTIRQLLSSYESSLNTSNADLAASCYTNDGLFMPTTLPTATGTEALKDSYMAIFGNIQLAVKFTVDELVITSDTSAYALTQSAGQVTVKATGDQAAEANREIFIFAKVDGDWKIARYMFNKSS